MFQEHCKGFKLKYIFHRGFKALLGYSDVSAVYVQHKSLGATLGSNSKHNHKEVTDHLSVHLSESNKFVTMGKPI